MKMFSQSLFDYKDLASYHDYSDRSQCEQTTQSSQDVSQPLQIINMRGLVEPNRLLNEQTDSQNMEYWSQQSSQHDETLRTYSQRPLLFTSKDTKHYKDKSNNSFNQFVSLNQKKSVMKDELEVLRSFIGEFKESTAEMASTMEIVQNEVSKNGSLEELKGRLDSSQEMLGMFQEKLLLEMRNQSDVFKEDIANDKSKESHVICEKIEEIERSVSHLQEHVCSLNEKATNFFETHGLAMQNLFNQINQMHVFIRDACMSETNTKLDLILQQNSDLHFIVKNLVSSNPSMKKKFMTVVQSDDESPLRKRLLEDTCVCYIKEEGNDIFDTPNDFTAGGRSKMLKKVPTESQHQRPIVVCDSVSNKSTPVQRSIRRYGKIKKFANAWDTTKKLSIRDRGKLEGESNRKVTLEDHWKSNEKQNVLMKGSRGSLAKKRKMWNVYNIEDGNDLLEMSRLLNGHRNGSRLRLSM